MGSEVACHVEGRHWMLVFLVPKMEILGGGGFSMDKIKCSTL